MLSQDGANRCIESAANELKNLTYEELLNRCERQGRDSTVSRELTVGGETVYLNTTIGTLGLIRKRVCVEMVLSEDGGSQWADTPCVYFERFQSGRLYEAYTKRWEKVVLKWLPYISLGGAVIVLVAIVWCLVARKG